MIAFLILTTYFPRLVRGARLSPTLGPSVFQTTALSVLKVPIFMVCVTAFHRPPLFFIQSLSVCLLSRFYPFAMAQNVLVDSGFKGMSSTPVNPPKAENPFKSVCFISRLINACEGSRSAI